MIKEIDYGFGNISAILRQLMKLSLEDNNTDIRILKLSLYFCS